MSAHLNIFHRHTDAINSTRVRHPVVLNIGGGHLGVQLAPHCTRHRCRFSAVESQSHHHGRSLDTWDMPLVQLRGVSRALSLCDRAVVALEIPKLTSRWEDIALFCLELKARVVPWQLEGCGCEEEICGCNKIRGPKARALSFPFVKSVCFLANRPNVMYPEQFPNLERISIVMGGDGFMEWEESWFSQKAKLIHSIQVVWTQFCDEDFWARVVRVHEVSTNFCVLWTEVDGISVK